MHHLFLRAHLVALNVELVLQRSDIILKLLNLRLILFGQFLHLRLVLLLAILQFGLELGLAGLQLLFKVFGNHLVLDGFFLILYQLHVVLRSHSLAEVLAILLSFEAVTLLGQGHLKPLLLSPERLDLVLSLLKLLLDDRKLASLRLGFAELSLQSGHACLVLRYLLAEVLLFISELVLDLADLLSQQCHLRLVLSLALFQLLACGLGHRQVALDLIELVLQPLLVLLQVLNTQELFLSVTTCL